MALKITSEIGTDQGITNEAYVRIVNYNINKGGQANFALQMFNSEAEATALSLGVPPGGGLGLVAKNAKIGESFHVALTKEVATTYTVSRPVPTEVEVTEEVIVPGGEEGSEPTTQTITKTVIQTIMTDVEETTVKIVPDMTPVIDIDVFAFGYGKLKTHLESLFGEGNIVDC
jgi:hypothetical protein